MNECIVCGDTDVFPRTCNECGAVVCTEHALPEKHGCEALRTDEIRWPTGDDHTREPATGGSESRDPPTHREKRRTRETPDPTGVTNTAGHATRDGSPTVRTRPSAEKMTTDPGNDGGSRLSAPSIPSMPSFTGPRRPLGRWGWSLVLCCVAALVYRYEPYAGSRLYLGGFVAAATVGSWALVSVGLWVKREHLGPGHVRVLQAVGVSLLLAGGAVAAVSLYEADPAASDRPGGDLVGPTDEPTPEVTRTSTPASASEEVTPAGESTALAGREREVAKLVHEEVNRVRAERGLPELDWNNELHEIAERHSKNMSDHGDLAHVEPDGDDLRDRYEEHLFSCPQGGGENVLKTYYRQPVTSGDGDTVTYRTPRQLADGAVTSWLNSDGHRENVLRTRWSDQGIGVFVEADGTVWMTQNFC